MEQISQRCREGYYVLTEIETGKILSNLNAKDIVYPNCIAIIPIIRLSHKKQILVHRRDPPIILHTHNPSTYPLAPSKTIEWYQCSPTKHNHRLQQSDSAKKSH